MRVRHALPRFAALLPAFLLGGCGLWPFGQPAPKGDEPDGARRSEARPQPGQMSERTRRYLASRGHEVIVERPLSVSADCTFRDETGYGGRLELEVASADVRRFSAQVNVPKRGSCRFDLADFHQTKALPTVMLASRRDACTVRMWEQADKVTVAFSDCRTQCGGATFDYLWPILVERPSGRCY